MGGMDTPISALSSSYSVGDWPAAGRFEAPLESFGESSASASRTQTVERTARAWTEARSSRPDFHRDFPRCNFTPQFKGFTLPLFNFLLFFVQVDFCIRLFILISI